jgi:hypothetical protein
MCGNRVVIPAVYDAALQENAVGCVQFPEEGTKLVWGGARPMPFMFDNLLHLVWI